MKKIWKMRKNREAVSPVIATILMVAITVVLAAVLYVMVMGFGTTGNQTPTGSFVGAPDAQAVGAVSGYKLQFGVLSPATDFADCKFVVTVDGVASAATAIVTPMTTPTAITTPANLVIRFTDLGGDGGISTGDYLTITSGTVAVPANLVSGSYMVTMLFTSTGGTICSQSWSF